MAIPFRRSGVVIASILAGVGRMVARVAVGIGVFVLGQSLASSPAGLSDTRVATGQWGGLHVALTVTEAGAELEFDCASGAIGQPLTIDSGGHLSVGGVFVSGHSGRQRAGEDPEPQPARYAGRVEGKTLTFEVTLKDSKRSMGPYTVTREAEPRLFKCR